MLRVLTKNISNQIKQTKIPIACFSTNNNKLNQQISSPRILITGGLGQIGVGLAKVLREKYGRDNIFLSDVKKASKDLSKTGPYVYADVLDFKGLQEIVVNNDIDWVIHMSAILSAVGENNVPLALRINIEGVHNVLELAKQHKLRIFIPSTIGIY
jgi:threonine 3-dehydrogenase